MLSHEAEPPGRKGSDRSIDSEDGVYSSNETQPSSSNIARSLSEQSQFARGMAADSGGDYRGEHSVVGRAARQDLRAARTDFTTEDVQRAQDEEMAIQAFMALKPACSELLQGVGMHITTRFGPFASTPFGTVYDAVSGLTDTQLFELAEFILYPLRTILLFVARSYSAQPTTGGEAGTEEKISTSCVEYTLKCIARVMDRLSSMRKLPLKEPVVTEIMALCGRSIGSTSAPADTGRRPQTGARKEISEDVPEECMIYYINICQSVLTAANKDHDLFKALSSNNENEFLDLSHVRSSDLIRIIPGFSHMVYILLEIAKDNTKRVGLNTRLSSLDTIQLLISDMLPLYNAKSCRLFLPGIVSSVARISEQASDTINHKILVGAVKILNSTVVNSLNDTDFQTERTCLDKLNSLDGLFDHSSNSTEAMGNDSNSKDNNSEDIPLDEIDLKDGMEQLKKFVSHTMDTQDNMIITYPQDKPTPLISWLLSTRKQMYTAFKIIISNLIKSDSYQVRLEIANCFGKILMHCGHESLVNCVPMIIVDCLAGLIADSNFMVSDTSKTAVLDYMNSWDETSSNSNTSSGSLITKDLIRNKISDQFTESLVKFFSVLEQSQVKVESQTRFMKEKATYLAILNGYMEILDDGEIQVLVNTVLQRITPGIFSLLAFDLGGSKTIKEMNMTVANGTQDGNWTFGDEYLVFEDDHDSLDGVQYILREYMPKISMSLPNFYDESLLIGIQTFFRNLGKKCDIDYLVEHFRKYLNIDDSHDKRTNAFGGIFTYDCQVLWILSHVIGGHYQESDIKNSLLCKDVIMDVISLIDAQDKSITKMLSKVSVLRKLYNDYSYVANSGGYQVAEIAAQITDEINAIATEVIGPNYRKQLKLQGETKSTTEESREVGAIQWQSSEINSSKAMVKRQIDDIPLIFNGICKNLGIQRSLIFRKTVELSSISIQTSDLSNIKTCLALDLVSSIQRFGPAHTMIKTLPFCLLRLGSPSDLVNRSAQIAVSRLSRYNDANSTESKLSFSLDNLNLMSSSPQLPYQTMLVHKLVSRNADYILNTLDWKLRNISENPDVLSFLRVVVRLSHDPLVPTSKLTSPLKIILRNDNNEYVDPNFGILYEPMCKILQVLDILAMPNLNESDNLLGFNIFGTKVVNGIVYNRVLKDIFDLFEEIFHEPRPHVEEMDMIEDTDGAESNEKVDINEFFDFGDDENETVKVDDVSEETKSKIAKILETKGGEIEEMTNIEESKFKQLPETLKKWLLTNAKSTDTDKSFANNEESDKKFEDAKSYFMDRIEENEKVQKKKQDPFSQMFGEKEIGDEDDMDVYKDIDESKNDVIKGVKLVQDLIEKILNFTQSSILVDNTSVSNSQSRYLNDLAKIQAWNVLSTIIPTVSSTKTVRDQVVASVWDVLETSIFNSNENRDSNGGSPSVQLLKSLVHAALQCLKTSSDTFLSSRVNEFVGPLFSLYAHDNISLSKSSNAQASKSLESLSIEILNFLKLCLQKNIAFKGKSSKLITDFILLFFTQKKDSNDVSTDKNDSDDAVKALSVKRIEHGGPITVKTNERSTNKTMKLNELIISPSDERVSTESKSDLPLSNGQIKLPGMNPSISLSGKSPSGSMRNKIVLLDDNLDDMSENDTLLKEDDETDEVVPKSPTNTLITEISSKPINPAITLVKSVKTVSPTGTMSMMKDSSSDVHAGFTRTFSVSEREAALDLIRYIRTIGGTLSDLLWVSTLGYGRDIDVKRAPPSLVKSAKYLDLDYLNKTL